MCTHSIRNNQILHDDRTRCEESFYTVHHLFVKLSMMQDYIFTRLLRSGLLAGGSVDAAGVGKLSDVSREVQQIGARLETVYPNLYQNVSRQVHITLKVTVRYIQ